MSRDEFQGSTKNHFNIKREADYENTLPIAQPNDFGGSSRYRSMTPYFKRVVGPIAVWVFCVLGLTACTRSVKWEEEVPLNNGETIVVHRSGSYTYKSEPGNPLKYSWGPDWVSTIAFTYNGKQYQYTGDSFILLIAIASDGTPNIVADARSWGNQNKYPCVTPYYVQFKPDDTGTQWYWPQSIDSWLYQEPTNLIIGLVPHDSIQKRYSSVDRQKQNGSVYVAGNHYRIIDPSFKPENCVKGN